MSTAVHWQVEDIDDALAADFDGSLSGLGMELGTSSFNMSETLLALPSLKSEHNNHHRNHLDHTSNGNNSDNSHQSSPYHHKRQHIGKNNIKGSNSESSSLSLPVENLIGDDARIDTNVHRKKNRLANGQDEESATSIIKRFCFSNEREASNADSIRYIFATHGLMQRGSGGDCNHEECTNEMKCQQRHSISAPDLRATQAPSILPHSGRSSPSTAISSPSSVLTQILPVPHPNGSFITSLHQSESQNTSHSSNSFQYLLGAPTSMATKVNEETMTYLNQGQPYEIKLKKLGDVSEYRGKMMKTIIRVGFHERRLQYMEKDLIMQWKQSRQSERILEIDIPLSYGIYENIYDSQEINKCEFLWEPTKETGVFVKVNCISTEFTPKKHGGEKGVPFRLIIETHSYNGNSKANSSTIIHAASCQIKVFKPKGADRKHKTDREKMSKRPQSEQEKFKPSFDCTAFTDYPVDNLYANSMTSNTNSGTIGSSGGSVGTSSVRSSPSSSPTAVTTIVPVVEEKNRTNPGTVPLPVANVVRKRSPSLSEERDPEPLLTHHLHLSSNTSLSSEASSEETAIWLTHNRFDSYIRTFLNFSGADLLKMTRNDLIQICGLTDGIRLFNAMHVRSIKPKLTLYVCNPVDEVFRAIYLENLNVSELKSKLASVILCSNDCYITRICLQGPSGIRVLVTDEVIQNFSEESIFFINFDRDGNDENTYEAILKPHK